MNEEDAFLPIGNDPDSADGMEPWRKRLLESLKASEKTMKAVSQEAGLNDSFLRDVLQRGRNPKYANLSKLALALNVSPSYILTGRDSAVFSEPEPTEKQVQSIPIRGQAAAGRWMEFDEQSSLYSDSIPAVLTEFEGQQFAFQVVGPSMDKIRIMDGDYVICVPFWGNVRQPRTGDVVVVERKRGATFERTVKQVVMKADVLELWPRSSDARYQSPIVINPSDFQEGDGTTIEFIGLVRAIHVPLKDR